MATNNATNTSNPITVAQGGTGLSSVTSHGILVGNGTGNIAPLAEATNGQIPIGSTGNAPVLASISAGTGISVTPGAGSITIANTGSVSAGVKVTTYTSSDTWTKDSNAKWVKVYIWGAGQGGGSGRKGLTTAAGGGSGGPAGGLAIFEGPASFFHTSQTVTIGGTTTGATGVSTDSTNGNGLTSIAAGSTLFGNINSSVVGASAGGTTTTANGGAYGTTLSLGLSVAPGVAPGQGSNTSPSNASSLTAYFANATGGGGGAGADAATARTGGSGAGLLRNDASTVIITGSAGGVETGTIDGTIGTSNPAASVVLGVLSGGTGGGGGGGQKTNLVGGGNGGNGGTPGGGGGGGGGALNDGTGTFVSGNGGNGARGQIIVVEFLN